MIWNIIVWYGMIVEIILYGVLWYFQWNGTLNKIYLELSGIWNETELDMKCNEVVFEIKLYRERNGMVFETKWKGIWNEVVWNIMIYIGI